MEKGIRHGLILGASFLLMKLGQDHHGALALLGARWSTASSQGSLRSLEDHDLYRGIALIISEIQGMVQIKVIRL